MQEWFESFCTQVLSSLQEVKRNPFLSEILEQELLNLLLKFEFICMNYEVDRQKLNVRKDHLKTQQGPVIRRLIIINALSMDTLRKKDTEE